MIHERCEEGEVDAGGDVDHTQPLVHPVVQQSTAHRLADVEEGQEQDVKVERLFRWNKIICLKDSLFVCRIKPYLLNNQH